VADRAADFYEPLQRGQQRGVDFVIRACQNRRLADGAGRLWDRLPQATVLGTVARALRARPGAAARRARVQLSCTTACFSGPWRPGGRQEDLAELQVLEVKELAAPAGVEPLRWILLTSLAGSSLTPARRIVGRYTARWHIAEYHKARQSGVGIEDSPLKQACRLESLSAVLSLVAIRLLNTKLRAAAWPDQPLAPDQVGVEALQISAQRFGAPKTGWTQSTFWLAVARLGGFIGRKGDGSPGWQTIWRGWQRLSWMTEGLDNFNHFQNKCG
jgi:hypothetical protein